MSKSFFRICSVIYRIILAFGILLCAEGIFVVEVVTLDTKHRRFLLLAYLVFTFLLLTAHQIRPYHRYFRWSALGLVLAGAVFSAYLLYQNFFECACLSLTDNLLAAVLATFLFSRPLFSTDSLFL